jgi:hypothetical protein
VIDVAVLYDPVCIPTLLYSATRTFPWVVVILVGLWRAYPRLIIGKSPGVGPPVGCDTNPSAETRMPEAARRILAEQEIGRRRGTMLLSAPKQN